MPATSGGSAARARFFAAGDVTAAFADGCSVQQHSV
jgi:hypothetical protein